MNNGWTLLLTPNYRNSSANFLLSCSFQQTFSPPDPTKVIMWLGLVKIDCSGWIVCLWSEASLTALLSLSLVHMCANTVACASNDDKGKVRGCPDDHNSPQRSTKYSLPAGKTIFWARCLARDWSDPAARPPLGRTSAFARRSPGSCWPGLGSTCRAKFRDVLHSEEMLRRLCPQLYTKTWPSFLLTCAYDH